MNKRLPQQPGEWIIRDHEFEFRFEGQTYRGYAGDSLSSALWANGVRVLGRSFKYHRPRGIYSLAGHDANVLVEDKLRGTNLRGDLEYIFRGDELRAVNTRGSVHRDWLNITEKFGRFLPVGFYYKAFHTPRWLFPFYEKQMRKVAGLGKVDPGSTHHVSPKDYAFCDLLIVGAGPAGLAAAVHAARSGLRVVIVDEQNKLGGSLAWRHAADEAARDQMTRLSEACRALDNVEIRCGTQVAGWYGDHWIALFDSRRLTKLRARAMLVAAGCIEQPAVFQNNDLPGVMLGSAAQRLIHLYAVKPMERAVVLAANQDGYQVALDMVHAGVEVAAIVDPRQEGEPSGVAERVREAGIEVRLGQMIYEAVPGSGKRRISGARICRLDAEGQPVIAELQHLACDGIACSVGWAPNGGLVYQAGGRFEYSNQLHQFVPARLPDSVFAAGRLNGVYALEDQIADGEYAATAAQQFLAADVEDALLPPRPARATAPQSHPFPIVPHKKKKNFVDFDEDLHVADFVNAWQEGYDNIELMKRFTTVGMGPSQGKLSNMNAIRILAKLNGSTIDETGSTTSRPFHRPVPLGHLAGRGFHPMRRTPLHSWHVAAGAEMVHAGSWYRPDYYRADGKSRDDCIRDEADSVRRCAGLIDVSTLGKLQISGPDAVPFLEFIYTGRFAKQAEGRVRYGVACDESGVIIEDGVVARLGESRFYVSATSSGAAAFYREMQRWAMLRGMDVTLANCTGHLAAFNLAGPRAGGILRHLTDLDLSRRGLPFLAAREGSVAGAPALVMRVGFVGELGYEIHTPAAFARHVWEALMKAGGDDITPFGVEAQRLLRLEKGHLIVGHDTDALTNPREAGVEWTIGKNKRSFVGSRSLEILKQRPLTRKLVGVRFADDHSGPLPEECHLILTNGEISGRVTSIAKRSTLGYPVAMCFVEPKQADPGTCVQIRVADGTLVDAEVVALPFYDAAGERQGLDQESVLEDDSIATAWADGSPARQSPLRNLEEKDQPNWKVAANAEVAVHWDSEHPDATQLVLDDLGAVAKLGVKGEQSAAWLRQREIAVPETIYASNPLPEGGLIVRLGADEFFLEDGVGSDFVAQLADRLDHDASQRPFIFSRSDATFLLGGARSHEILAQTCAIDFRAAQPGRAIMTRIAGASAMIVPATEEANWCYRITIDASLAVYLWQTLSEIGGLCGSGAEDSRVTEQ